MIDVSTILNMLDWHMPPEVQARGISLAKDIEDIDPFIQSLTPKHNKNVWDNCAIIIAGRSDEEIKPHLVKLLEWLQDMNWPGAFSIMSRLQKYLDHDYMRSAIKICIEKAKGLGDAVWEDNLYSLLSSHE